MAYLLKPYDDALSKILLTGIKKQERTGVSCLSIAGIQSRYSLESEYFPIVTGRKLWPKAVFAELLWFISGSTKNQDLEKLGAKFWGKWCDENNPTYKALRVKWGYEPGDFGPIYGWQLRHFGADYISYRSVQKKKNDFYSSLNTSNEKSLDDMSYANNLLFEENEVLSRGFDQLAYMVNILQIDPFGANGRRCMFSLWNPNDFDKIVLPACHYTYQAVPDGDGGLTGILTQRSADWIIGVPANVQFYSALTIMLAQQADMKPKEFVHNANDCHIYENQIEQVKEYLSRPKPDSPKLNIKKAKDIFSYSMDDFVLTDYNPQDKIDIPVQV